MSSKEASSAAYRLHQRGCQCQHPLLMTVSCLFSVLISTNQPTLGHGGCSKGASSLFHRSLPNNNERRRSFSLHSFSSIHNIIINIRNTATNEKRTKSSCLGGKLLLHIIIMRDVRSSNACCAFVHRSA